MTQAILPIQNQKLFSIPRGPVLSNERSLDLKNRVVRKQFELSKLSHYLASSSSKKSECFGHKKEKQTKEEPSHILPEILQNAPSSANQIGDRDYLDESEQKKYEQ